MSVKLAESEVQAVTGATRRGLQSKTFKKLLLKKLTDIELRIFKEMAFQIL